MDWEHEGQPPARGHNARMDWDNQHEEQPSARGHKHMNREHGYHEQPFIAPHHQQHAGMDWDHEHGEHLLTAAARHQHQPREIQLIPTGPSFHHEQSACVGTRTSELIMLHMHHEQRAFDTRRHYQQREFDLTNQQSSSSVMTDIARALARR